MESKRPHQRSFWNYIRTAGLSRGYYLHVFVGGMSLLCILMAYAIRLLSEINQIVAAIPDISLSASLEDRLATLALVFFFSFLAFVFTVAFYTIVISQRVGGPVVALTAFIKELQNGNYDAKRTLRKNDELVPVMEELHALAKILKDKHGAKKQ